MITADGKNNYTGIEQRGRVQESLQEHLPCGQDSVPGTKVRVQQMPTISEAKAYKARIIVRTKPSHNIQGK